MDYEIETLAELEQIAKTDRLRPVLVRCSCCRFQAPAQDVRRIINALVKDGESLRDMYCSTPISRPMTNLEAYIR